MKEITRIHIAKTPYDIELAAKKTLETYMHALEAYSDDTEIIEDVEIRITEILAERGVRSGGIITAADVKALQRQLGDPSEFMGEGDMAVGRNGEAAEDGLPRKLYRDGDNAIVGGVLAGIAAFFKINPLWMRLVFILLALASFGTAILVYAVLWMAVPEAKTAADKLQMNGRAVTLRAIREINETDAHKPPRSGIGSRRVGLAFLGTLCVMGATGAASLTVAALFGGIFARSHIFSSAAGGFFVAAFVLALASGALLTTLFILGAYASFARKFDRRIVIGMSVVIVLGLVSFGTAAGFAKYGSTRDIQVRRQNTREETLKLPKGIASVTGLKVTSGGVRVRYVVRPGTSSATLSATAWHKTDMPHVEMKMENATLQVNVTRSAAECGRVWGCERPVLTIYGPTLTRMTAEAASVVEYSADRQQRLKIDAQRDSEVAVSGTLDTLEVTAAEETQVSAGDATVKHLETAVKASAILEAGTVQSFALTHDNACPAHSHEAAVSVQRIVDERMTVNGADRPARTTRVGCIKISIGSEEE
jgi:phage shock protein PspC (stress-responsive transcriptional regulator)